MCGLTGFWTPDGLSIDQQQAAVCRMADTIRHRGPDDEGTWVDQNAGLALGFRRLAILDLSEAGHQPMPSRTGRYVIVFNGEIYNYADLRSSLAAGGATFRGASDTEVLLALVERDGVEQAIGQAHGMFAIAVWDRENRQLWLARDRVGKKPLYFGTAGRTLVFGSELKALAAWPGFDRRIDRQAVASFMRFGYVPAPYSIYKNAGKVRAGEIVVFRDAQVERRLRYWDPITIARDGREQREASTDDRCRVDELDRLLRDAVRRRMVADVPLGAFLSGGIDSSLVVALMQAQSAVPVRTFTIGFDVPGYDEAVHAKAVAAHLGTAHTELYVSPSQAMDVIPALPDMFDEPFSDSSQIPTYLVSHLARQHVTVSLSGDGGDEGFAGYTRYQWANAIWRRLSRIPRSGRGMVARALLAPRPETIDRAYALVEPVLPGRLRQSHVGDKVAKLAAVLDVRSPDELYKRLVSLWKHPEGLVRGGTEHPTILDSPELLAGSTLGFSERMMLLDLLTYLPDDILVKVDRASMAVSLEARAPLLDHRVLEWAWRQPMACKVRDGRSKWLLREVVYRYVPRALIERPKMGFGVPLHAWLRGPLRDWAESLLSPTRLADTGVFQAGPVQAAWQAHVSGARNDEYRLWAVLTYQAWHQRWGGTP